VERLKRRNDELAMPTVTDTGTMPSLDYEDLFRHLPVAVIVGRERIMVDCNARALELFRAQRSDIVNQSFSKLYPQRKDFTSTGRRLAPLIAKRAVFNDDRIMRRIDGSHFWVTVCGYGYNAKRPFELAVWTFTDLSKDAKQADIASTLTERERDVAAFLVHGLTSKEIGKELNISPRTVDIHRASLLRKYEVRATSDLIARLVA
jgi:DNA-binding CsgD family transcriptional regulator